MGELIVIVIVIVIEKYCLAENYHLYHSVSINKY